ncbi:MAG: translation initiation factor IF-2 N-terminal domain-containing protein [Candidatus Omnitrophica bacterium]|nr:translation initiation factor IF-2 N-terminal domain-containing protein [Candidatus Omnitrophota bacterium]
MRIYEFAKEHDLQTKDVLEFLDSIGISKTAVAQIDQEAMGRVLSHFGKSAPGVDPGIGPSPHTLSDHWTLFDTLGYEPYAYALYRFLVHEQTQPPLTISIQAPWGGGKTSMMRMIQNHLDPYSMEDQSAHSSQEGDEEEEENPGLTVGEVLRILRHPRTPIRNILAEDHSLSRFVSELLELFQAAWIYFTGPIRGDSFDDTADREWEKILESTQDETINDDDSSKNLLGTHRFTVWFNAWKYQSANQIWAGLMDAIVRQICSRMRPRQRDRFLLELQLHRASSDAVRKQILGKIAGEFWMFGQWLTAGLAAGVVGFFASGSLGWQSVQSVMALWCLVDVVWMAAHFILTYFRFRKKQAAEPLKEFIDCPHYQSTEASLDALDKDLRGLFETLRKPQVWMHPDYQHYSLPLMIFVDDLDRCSPENTATVIEGLNQFLAGDYPEAMFVLGIDAEMVAAALEQANHKILSSLPGNPAETLIGWRFMDKFVQMPFDIPLPESENLENYTRSLLTEPVASEGMRWAREVVWSFDTPVKSDIPSHDIADNILDELLGDGSEESIADFREQLHSPLVEDIEKQRKERSVLDEGIGRFSDGESDVQSMILERAPQFSRNPREIKRFLNVFRFRYALWWRRQKQNLPNASLDQLVRWVEFTLKWPHVLRWLKRTTLSDQDSGDLRKASTRIARGLQHLEKIAKEKPSERAAKFRELFQTDPYRLLWINDEALMAFYSEEAKMPPGSRLSSCEGMGMF